MSDSLVFVPGLLCDGRLWESQIEAVSDVCEPSVADVSKDDCFEEVARRLLEVAPGRFSLCGLSMGGYVALSVVANAPERVERLALLDTSARADTPEQTRARLDLLDLAKARGLGEVVGRLLPRLLHPSRLDDERLAATVANMALSEKAIIARPDRLRDLASIQCPTLVLCGRDDQITPVELHEEMAAEIPDSTLRVVERCGHLSPLERPGQVNAALRAWIS
jgi:pimeloyl-ACP methyl ester carboxylesterase